MDSKSEPQAPLEHVFAPFAAEFIHDAAARALLRIPGCQTVFVNDVHRRAFSANLETVSSTRDVARLLRKENELANSKPNLSDSPCYCHPMNAVIALVGRHCVFERAHIWASKSKDGLSEDFAAFNFRNNGTRDYRLYIVKMRHLQGDAIGYIDAEYTEFAGLTVAVSTEDNSARSGAATRLCARTTLDDEDFIRPQKCTVSGEEGYNLTYDFISQAIAGLRKGAKIKLGDQEKFLRESKENLLAQVFSHRKTIDYEAVRGFVNGIYGCESGGCKESERVDAVIRELTRVQDGLFDSLVIVDRVIESISEKTKSWPRLAG